MFSSRLPAVLGPNAVSRTTDTLRASGAILLDLTLSNPSEAAISYPPDLLSSLADPRGLQYTPHPQGLEAAREAVAAGYRRQGVDVGSGQVFLTASTSEAYALLFKLLADPGDHVLVPQPGYPLFELLTRLEAVVATPYSLEYHGRWSIDRSSLEQALTPRTRAILIVSPNNPTGSMLRAADRDWLVELGAARNIALISDEVFSDYRLAARSDAVSLAGEPGVLTFALGGLSKSAGLPQLKLAWIAASGPAALVADARTRLEVICDTYLSVSTPVQLAAPALLETGRTIRQAIQSRITRNLAHLRTEAARHPAVTLLDPEAGWSAVLRVPATMSEEALVLRLAEEAGVLVHPGYFFDFPSEAWLVISLLPEPAILDEGISRLLRLVTGRAH